MKIVIPQWLADRYNAIMDWIAWHILPPPVKMFKVYNYWVSALDLALVGYSLVFALVACWWYNSWYAFPIVIGVNLMIALWLHLQDKARENDNGRV